MFELPEKGVSVSKSVHNCDELAIIDWVLASALFCEEDISRSDLLDTLMENQVYTSQDFCQEFVADIWRSLESFFSDITTPTLAYDHKAIRYNAVWKEDKAFSYCLTASLRVYYDTWSKESCGNHLVQGSILEELTKLSLGIHHPNINFKSTGWSGVTDNKKFSELIAQICGDTNFTEQNLALWDNGSVKDMGLDVYGYFPGKGRRPSAPFMMFQCASGNNWKNKRGTPDLNVWKNIISTYTAPIRGMAIPFLVSETDFQQSLILLGGPLLDRTMLLSGIAGNAALGDDLKLSIDNWVEERITKLDVL